MTFLKYTFLSVSFLSVFYAHTAFSQCIEGKIKHTFQNKEVITNENYCYDLESVMLMSSDSCAEDKTCQNRDLGTVELTPSESSTESGSIGFKICDKYNGTPQIIDFWAVNEWHSSSRCIFSDGSFIDNSSLAQKVKYLD